MALSLLVSVGPQYEEVLALLQGSWIMLIAIVPNMLFGVITGLGLALLLNHASREKFAELQPGHWRLIVVMLGIVRYLLSVFVFEGSTYYLGPPDGDSSISFEFPSPFPELIQFTLITIFYILILRTTQEADAWRWYAWAASIVFGISVVLKVLPVTQLPDIYGPSEMAYTPLDVLFLGVAAVATYGPYLLGLLMICGVIRDLVTNVARDVYHYLGIVLVAIQPGVQIWLDFIAAQYFLPPLS